MNPQKPNVVATATLMLTAAALIVASASWSDEFPFRTAFARVPGVKEIEAGWIQVGIEVLEDQLDMPLVRNRGEVLATLCAAYTINATFDKAEQVCNEAVESHGTYTAYNNRGVFRVLTGDWVGARNDFERALPRDMEAYLEEMKTSDVRLMASDNLQRIDKLAAAYDVGLK